MSEFFKIRVIDEDSINYLIRNLEDFEKDRAIRDGLAEAGKVFAAGGRRRLRERMKSGSRGVTGNLLRSFKVRVKKRKLGMLTGFEPGAGSGSHAHLIDRGTADRYQKKRNNKYVGHVIGNKFWLDTEAQDYPGAMDKLYIGIERAVDRINSRR